MNKKLVIVLVVFFLALSTIYTFPYAKAEGGNNGIPALISKIEERLSELEETNKNLSSSIEQLEMTIKSQETQIHEQENKIESLTNFLGNTQKELSYHEEQLGLLANQASENSNLLSTLQNDVSTIRNDINRLLQGTQPNPSQGSYSIEGTIKFTNNEPIRLAKIYVINQLGQQTQFESGWQGEFSLMNLANGQYTLKVGSVQNPLLEKTISVNSQNQTGINLISNVQLYNIKGKMIDLNGKEFYAGLVLVDKNTGVYYSESPRDFKTFNFQVPNGIYQISYHVPGFNVSTPTEIVVNGKDENVDINLSVSTHSVRGKAVDKNGNPLASESISFSYGNGGIFGYNFNTDREGNFAINGLVDGQYTINIGKPQNPIASLPITINGSDLNGLVVTQ
ncbi:carboxypeptidase-like regulatory domain-containing protein [Bacillus sp. ISL-41]|uniref:carboxypeptidase-like regulatory domain-containing protein n=1 Tax=Bacillus sp. ISL-41 TaxID=2819127 RepID=UPI001BEC4428|nr:carboxypeptidase-like regulatory domain-containing protein [Bacillus sp. ISL-41]MBT2641692.1 carboxypeptidase-like regulatory domain-containing protein [Bacillus sp. ISL-41]